MGSQIETKPPHVVVVGAGIVGASLAWHLARDGAHVTVVAEEVGGTATPCSFAWLNASWNNPRFYYDFRRRSMAGWKRLAEEVPRLRALLQWNGGLGWDLPPEKREAYLKEHAAWGYDIRRVDRAEIRALEPALSPDADFLPEWGLRTGEEGSVEAAEAARVLVADAQARNGGAVLVTAAVTELLVSEEGHHDDDDDDDDKEAGGGSRRIRGVKTATGETIPADHVVLAAGVGSAALAATAGVTVPVSSPPGLLIHTKPATTPGGGRRPLLRSVVYATGLHMRQAPDGRILSGADFAGGDPGADPQAAAEALLARVRAAFHRPQQPGNGAAEPELEPEPELELELDYFTVGYRPVPRDGLPILGDTGVGGLSVAVMHSGVTNAAVVGELLARKILTGREDEALGHFSLGRFGKREGESEGAGAGAGAGLGGS